MSSYDFTSPTQRTSYSLHMEDVKEPLEHNNNNSNNTNLDVNIYEMKQPVNNRMEYHGDDSSSFWQGTEDWFLHAKSENTTGTWRTLNQGLIYCPIHTQLVSLCW